MLMHCLRASMETFEASELSICLALICLCVNQSLLREPRLLDNDDKRAHVQSEATVFLILALVMIVAFSLLVVFRTLVFDLGSREMLVSLRCVQVATLVVALPVLRRALHAQRSFALRGGLWT